MRDIAYQRPAPPLALSALVFLILVGVVAACQDAQPQFQEKDFIPLVSGADPQQFQLIGFGRETITVSEAGEVALSGNPSGYFATREQFGDYVLRFDWKYDRPADLKEDAAFDGNSGVLLHIAEPHKVWPLCIEAQLMNRDAGHLFAIGGGKFSSRRSDEQRREAQQKAVKPVGEWNSEEIVCRNGTIRVSINGTLIDEGEGAEPSKGPIGWQSEGRPIRFRNLRINKL
jgi:hypothetical protein